MPIPIEVSAQIARKLVDRTSTFLLDCDGVIWKGKELIPGICDTLSWLRSLGKSIFFVTNNSTSSRTQYKKKINGFNIQCDEDEIWCSAYLSALYLKSVNFKKKVYVIGMQGIADEFVKAGIEFVNIEKHNGSIESFVEAIKYRIDDDIGAVLVGMDIKVNYAKIAYAQLHLRDREDCLFLATNDDNTLPCEEGRILPGGGSIVKMLEYCTEREAFLIGKPNTWFLDTMFQKHHVDKSTTLMVGDKLATDMVFGNNGNLKTLLVLSGVTALDELDSESVKSNPSKIPNYFTYALPELMRYYLEGED